jgi:hypothetical protein
MARKKNLVTIDDQEFDYEKFSENAKSQFANVRFVDERIQQLQNELAVADTARIGYTNALKKSVKHDPEG